MDRATDIAMRQACVNALTLDGIPETMLRKLAHHGLCNIVANIWRGANRESRDPRAAVTAYLAELRAR